MATLVPCTECRRHVRADDAACPFCGAAIPEGAAARAVPAARGRLDRVAFFTFATTIAAAACSSGGAGSIDDAGAARDGTAKDDGAARDDSGVVKDDGGMQAAYGISPIDSGGAQPPYGVPPFDAGTE